MSDFDPTQCQQNATTSLQPVDEAGWIPDSGTPNIHRREHGAVSLRVIIGTVGAVALAIPAFMWGSGYGERDGSPFGGVSAHDDTTHVEAKSLGIKATERLCLADSPWDVSGSVIKYQMTVSNKDIPQFGGQVTFGSDEKEKDPKTGKEKLKFPAIVMLNNCIKDASKYNGTRTTVTETNEVDADTNFKKEVVKIPVDSIEVLASFPPGNDNLYIDQYAGLKLTGGASGIAAAAAKAQCNVLTAFQLSDFCDNISGKIDSWKRDFDSKAPTSARTTMLQFIQKEGSKANWENVKLAFRDAYKDMAVNQANGDVRAADAVEVEFVDSHGNPTTALPNFGENAYAAWEKAGLLAPADNIGWDVDMSAGNFKIVKPPAYEPKYKKVSNEQSGPVPTATTKAGAN